MEIEVAVPTPLNQTFTYKSDEPVPPGSRVLVPFGSRKVVGVAMGPRSGDQAPDERGFEIKPVESVIDEIPVYSETVLEVARWISRYYMHPLGEVLRTMLPASAMKVTKESLSLTDKGHEVLQGEGALDDEETAALRQLFKRKKTVTRATLTKNLRQLKKDGTVTQKVTLSRLTRRGLVSKSRGTTMRARETGDGADGGADEAVASAPTDRAQTRPEDWPTLTAQQQQALGTIVEKGFEAEGRKAPFLIHGVTGSGKTEIYLRLIREVLEREPQSGQALVLVPEISLTPQMTRAFETRFPDAVAVVHSALTDAERWARLERIRTGEARILIGPRSAVFGPFQSLRLIIVDEEHDSSYKQATGLTYNGRDVAVLRGHLENAAVVLGSATPSMESYRNAVTGKYTLIELPERVSGRPLPEVELITAEKNRRRGVRVSSKKPDDGDSSEGGGEGELPIDEKVMSALRENLEAGHQAMVLVNRRGYAYYLFSLDERKAIECPHCSISLTLHKRSTILRCHYCDYKTTLPEVEADRPGDSLVAVGYGSEKAEDCLRRELPGARIARLDSDTTTKKNVLPETLGKFRRGEVDLLVGTQMLAKGHDFPNVTLIVLLEVDQHLSLPDFRAGERTFQLVVQAAGRAGRAELPGRVLIQTIRGSHPILEAAIRQDFAAFARAELAFREGHGYPPFARMIAFEITDTDRERVEGLAQRMENWFAQLGDMQPEVLNAVQVLGPAVPAIETIRGRHRRTILLTAQQTEPLRQLAGQFLAAFSKLPGDSRLRIDVDPQSLI